MKIYSKEYTIPTSGVLVRNSDKLMLDMPRLNLPAKAIMITGDFGGIKKIQKGTSVAGNVAVTKTVPSGKIWLLLNIHFILITDATVADRICQVETRDSANAVKFLNTAYKITASLTQNRTFARGLSTSDSGINGLGEQLLIATEDINLSIVGGVAGDAYDYLVEYLEIDNTFEIWLNEDEEQKIRIYGHLLGEKSFKTPIIEANVLGFKLVGTPTKKITVHLFYEPMKGVITKRKIEKGEYKQT